MSNPVNSTAHHWSPCEDILTDFKSTNYAVIVLNCRMHYSFPENVIVNLWTNAKLRLTVDGGTQRWLNWIKYNNLGSANLPAPELITGDMDSIDDNVIEYFKERSSEVIRTPDQNETDFTKALKVAKNYVESKQMEIDIVYVLGDTSGRFDQIMANINSLFKASTFFDVKLFQLASNSVTWLLQEGSHVISIPENLRKSKEWCALIPIGGPCMVSSKGLKWNLDNSELKFGGMVSTSNTYNEENEVKIHTNFPIIWSMGIENLTRGCSSIR